MGDFLLGAAVVLALLGLSVGLSLTAHRFLEKRRHPERLDLQEEVLLSAYLSGMGSGYGSFARGQGIPAPLALMLADSYARKVRDDFYRDPAVRHEILTRLHGLAEAIETGDLSKVPGPTDIKPTRGDQ